MDGIIQSYNSSYNFVVNANKTLIANFESLTINITGNENASSLVNCSNCDVTVLNGGLLTIDTPTAFDNLSIAGGGKATNENQLNISNFTINSDNTNGTGTSLDNGVTNISGTLV